MRTFQLMPGVSAGSEGSSGLLVRGGTSDQNLYLLDNVPIYNVNHIGGFLSIFDNDAIKSLQVLKGGFPARFGGRTSSVVDVQLKDGNRDSINTTLSIGILSSKIALNGPLGKKKKTLFNVSLRRSMLDIFTRYIPKAFGNDFVGAYTIFDGTARVMRELNEKNKLILSFYNGNDHFLQRQDYSSDGQNTGLAFQVESSADIRWGNTMGSLKWQQQPSSNLFGTIALSYTSFRYLNKNEAKRSNLEPEMVLQEFRNRFDSNIKDFALRANYEWSLNAKNDLIRFGGESKRMTFLPSLSSFFKSGASSTSLDTTFTTRQLKALESSVYAEYQFQRGKRFSGNLGLHTSLFSTPGKNYLSLQPRVSLSYALTEKYRLKASFSQMQQNLHLLVNSGLGLPTDLWVPATEKIKPQTSWQANLGVQGYIPAWQANLEVDFYYKSFSNLIAFAEGVSFFTGNANWEDRVEVGGEGEAYGAEILLRKTKGKNTGWIGLERLFLFAMTGDMISH